MDEEKELYARLIALSKEKQGILTKNDVANLGRVVADEEAVVTRLMELDRKKTDALSALGRLKGAAEPPSLASIADMAGDPAEKSKLEALLEDFRAIACELSAQNELNQRLIETQLRYTNFFLGLITQDESAVGDFYGSTGQILQERESSRRAFFDRKV